MRGASITCWELERPGLTMPVRPDPSGICGPTPGQARGPRWRKTSRGLVVPSTVDGEQVEQRIVEAAAVLPPATGVTGWAALRWGGAHWFDGLGEDGRELLPVTLAIGDSTIGSQSGYEVSEEHLRPHDLITVDGMPLTTHVRSVTYLMRHASSLRQAVAALDMAAYGDLVSVEEVVAYNESLWTWAGIPQSRQAAAYADENAWSPREVGVRLTWILTAGLPRPLTNRPVFDRWGHHLGTPDLFDEEAGMVVEYDGAVHLVGARRRRDRDREERFRRAGLEYLTVLGSDRDEERLAARMHEARGRARFEAPARRSWTLDLPRWWVPTFNVEQRRNLSEYDRTRLLRFRRTA